MEESSSNTINRYQIIFIILICVPIIFCMKEFYIDFTSSSCKVPYKVLRMYSPADLISHKHSSDVTIIYKMDLQDDNGHIITKEVSTDTYYKTHINQRIIFTEHRSYINTKYNIVLSIIISSLGALAWVVLIVASIIFIGWGFNELYISLGNL